MFQTKLTNGVTVCYEADANGRLVLRYPDGSQVRTTWSQLGLLETVVQNLRELYEYLLLQASGDRDDAGPPVEKLVQLDDLLFALSTPAKDPSDPPDMTNHTGWRARPAPVP